MPACFASILASYSRRGHFVRRLIIFSAAAFGVPAIITAGILAINLGIYLARQSI